MTEPRLRTPVEDHLTPTTVDEARMWRAFELRRAEDARLRRVRWRRRLALSGVAMSAAAAGLVFWFADRAPTPGALRLQTQVEVPRIIGADGAPEDFSFDDGSRVLLGPDTEAELLTNTGREVVTELHRGVATFDIRPGGPRMWVIQAGALRVSVLGTRFSVDERASRVVVERGRVRIQHPELERPLELTRGESWAPGSNVSDVAETESPQQTRPPSSVVPERVERSPSPSAATDVLAARSGEAESSGVPASRRVAADSRRSVRQPRRASDRVPGDEPMSEPDAAPASRDQSWRAAADRAEWRRAYDILTPAGFRARVADAPADELLVLADVARRSGHSRDAALAFSRVLRVAPSDPRARIAAFALGRLQLDRLGQPAAAARSFAFVRQHAGASALAEDAMALETRALRASGDVAAARRAAERYLSRYPEGRRAAQVRRWARID